MKFPKKRYALIVFSFFMVLLFSIPAFPHPPKDVALSLNGGVLTVKADHSVDSPDKHYIYRITIYIDNKVVASRDYKSQTDAGGVTDMFEVGDLAGGTVIKAEVFCVIMGSSTGILNVP